jgi:phosphate transport system substrate-binding protein
MRGQPGFRLAVEEYPVVDGSTSTQPLGALIASRVTRTSFEWQQQSIFDPTRRLGLTTAPYDESKKLALDETPVERGKPAVLFSGAGLPLADKTRHLGTSQSYAQLAAGRADLMLAARDATPEEREAARRAGSEIVVQPIARDAFVFLRNVKNPVTSLTIEQVRDIYSGRVTHWKQVGGTEHAIAAYQRDAASGSQVEMEQLVMRGRPMLDGPDIRLTVAMFGPFNAVRQNPNGIGYSYHYYERFMAAVPEVATLAINGVAPDRATIADGTYPLATFVYLAHRKDLPAGSAAAKLRDWLRTPAGQAVVAESGYVRLR